MSFQYPEIKVQGSNKQINLTATDKPDWGNNTCNSNEVFSPNKETKALKSKQSPVNINTEAVQECHLLCKLNLNYKPSKCHVERTEQGIIKFNWDPGSSISYNNITYELKYIQIHTPSLHHIDNKSSEMEINLYHYNHANMEEVYQDNRHVNGEDEKENTMEKIKEKYLPDVLKDDHPHTDTHQENKGFKSERGVIISILVNHSTTSSKNGETMASRPNMFISQFIHNENFLDLNKKKKTSEEHETRDIEVHKDWNVTDLLPKSKAYYTYDGSIPFPPCVENFKWVVFEQHIDVIEEFINILRSEGNPMGFRNVHPLNNRVVYYNNNIEVKSGEGDSDKGTNKHDEVKKMLAPIRIKVDNRTGYEYRKKSQDIIASYTSGSKSNYMNDNTVLISINKDWDDVGKIGYEEVPLDYILDDYINDDNKELTELGKNFTKYIVFDSNLYDGDYFNKTLPILGYELKEGNISIPATNGDTNGATNGENISMQSLLEAMPKIYENIEYNNFSNSTNSKKLDMKAYEEFLKTMINNNIDNDLPLFPQYHLLILYTLLEADLNHNPSQLRNHLKIPNQNHILEFEQEFWKIYFKEMKDKNNDKIKEIIFKSRSDDLNTTINNYSCQKWGSNSVHHEGSIWNTFSPDIHLKNEGYTLEEIDDLPFREKHRIKKAIRDGLLDYISDNNEKKRFIPNNKCRNPNGSATAAWCYTTNPKVRWDYCMKPDISFKTRKLLLVVIFIFIIYLAYYTVKLVFEYNMFNKFMARLTGAQLPKDMVFKANQVAGTIRNNLQGIK